jgi:hypothetical protein
MRSRAAYLVVMMAMMGCFAVFSVEQRALILAPGNLAVGISLGLGGLALALDWTGAVAIGLFAAAVTAAMGGLAVAQVAPQQVRLPGAPFLWVVIGLYLAFRLTLHHRQQTPRRLGSPSGISPVAALVQAGDHQHHGDHGDDGDEPA